MKTGYIIGGAAAVIIMGALATAGASAYRGNPAQFGPNYTPERHEQMEKAFENKDYNAWKSLQNGRGRVSEVVNEGNFFRFSEMHKLMEEGKTAEANQIRQELGLGIGGGQGQRGNGTGGCMR